MKPNKLCKKYISSLKYLFPVTKSREKKYIENLKIELLNFIEDNNITSIDELYEKYGSPGDIISDYYSATNLDEVIKTAATTKLVKKIGVVFLIIATIFASILCTDLIKDCKVSLENLIDSVEIILSVSNEDGNIINEERYTIE